MGDQLPAGKECFDCIHVGRCCLILNTQPGKSVCIYSPGQFEQNPGLLDGVHLPELKDEDENSTQTHQR